MATLFLVFWGTSILFSIVAIPTYIPTQNVGGFPFLHTGCHSWFFNGCRLIRSYFSVICPLFNISTVITPHPQILLLPPFIWITAPNFAAPTYSLQRFLPDSVFPIIHSEWSRFSHTSTLLLASQFPLGFSWNSLIWETWVPAMWGPKTPNILESCWQFTI